MAMAAAGQASSVAVVACFWKPRFPVEAAAMLERYLESSPLRVIGATGSSRSAAKVVEDCLI